MVLLSNILIDTTNRPKWGYIILRTNRWNNISEFAVTNAWVHPYPCFNGVRAAISFVYHILFLLIIVCLLSIFFWTLHCMSVHLRLLIIPFGIFKFVVLLIVLTVRYCMNQVPRRTLFVYKTNKAKTHINVYCTLNVMIEV
jgi:hypothetical protein